MVGEIGGSHVLLDDVLLLVGAAQGQLDMHPSAVKKQPRVLIVRVQKTLSWLAQWLGGNDTPLQATVRLDLANHACHTNRRTVVWMHEKT